MISVRRLAEQEHSTALDQLLSRISVMMKFGAGADGDPFVKVKDLITDLISRVQAEASSVTNRKSHCDAEMSKITEKREDLEADITKHSSKLEAAVARSIDLMNDVPVVMQQQMPVQKTAETSQLQFSNKVDEMPVAVQRQVPMVQTVQKTVEIPQPECIDTVIDDPVVQVPQMRVMEKTVEGPQLQIIEQIVEIPETQTIQGARTSDRSGTAPVCQMTQAEIGEVIEIGASIPAESASSILVTAPVLEKFSSCCWV